MMKSFGNDSNIDWSRHGLTPGFVKNYAEAGGLKHGLTQIKGKI